MPTTYTPSDAFLAFQARIAARRAEFEARIAADREAAEEANAAGPNVSSQFVTITQGPDGEITRTEEDERTGDFIIPEDADTTGGSRFVTITRDDNGDIVTTETTEAEQAPIEPVEVAAPAPVAPATEDLAPSSNVSRSFVTVSRGEDGEPVVEGELGPNAELTLNPVEGLEGGERDGNVTIVANTEGALSQAEEPEPEAAPANVIDGTEVRDRLTGTNDNDVISGNGGNDYLRGRDGDDVIAGGAGRDFLDGGLGNDTFVFNEGDGFDRIRNFDLLGDDRLQINVDGIDSVEDFLGALVSVRDAGDAVSATFDFGDGDRLNIVLDSVDNLGTDDFLFG